jgi:hypothetical protein
VTINRVVLNNLTSSPPDYTLTGLPGDPTLPPPLVVLEPGQQLGSGDLDVVFAPFTIARTSTGTVDVNFVNDPITLATTTVSVPFCGEAVQRGLRVLVTEGGTPVSKVKSIQLQEAFGPEQQFGIFTLRTIKNAPLTTILGAGACPTFSSTRNLAARAKPSSSRMASIESGSSSRLARN